MGRDEDGQDGHPVIWGLVALVSVALVIGLVFGGAALLGTRVLGLGDGEPVGGQATADDSLYLPTPSTTQRTPSPSAAPAPSGEGSASASIEPSGTPSEAATPITLVAGQKQVTSFGRIDLSGSYPDGEGAVLEVQRREGRRWAPFYSVTAVVVGGQFATVVQTSRSGVSAFRVVDSDNGKASNPVRVTVS